MFYELFNSKDNQTEQLFAKRNQTMGDFSGKKPPCTIIFATKVSFFFFKRCARPHTRTGDSTTSQKEKTKRGSNITMVPCKKKRHNNGRTQGRPIHMHTICQVADQNLTTKATQENVWISIGQ
jgi:hypothetical protein